VLVEVRRVLDGLDAEEGEREDERDEKAGATAARCRPARTKWMASATVSELVMRTMVFTVPAQISLVRDEAAKATGNEYRYTA
jgi:hypothetical protein